jgi:folate-binding protein YgfZ
MNDPMTTLQQLLEPASMAGKVNEDANFAKAGFVCRLSDFSLIQANGEDAANFLHNQLSNDVEHLGLSEARLAAYCSPKGRMLASLFYWKTENGIFLQLSASLQAPIQKRLQMFVMRAKVKLLDVSNDLVVLGLGGENASQTLQNWFPQLPASPYKKIDNASGTLIRVADGFNQPRYQWICTMAVLQNAWSSLAAQLQIVDQSNWRKADILAGIPQITDRTQEKFVPQMVNFELIGGVNFKKGCYPGQEIVARSQYLGKLKRRMAIASIPSNHVETGMEVFSEADTSQPCGMIINAESDGELKSICLVELKVADQEEDQVHLGSSTGPKLNFLPLPYSMLDVTA